MLTQSSRIHNICFFVSYHLCISSGFFRVQATIIYVKDHCNTAFFCVQNLKFNHSYMTFSSTYLIFSTLRAVLDCNQYVIRNLLCVFIVSVINSESLTQQVTANYHISTVKTARWSPITAGVSMFPWNEISLSTLEKRKILFPDSSSSLCTLAGLWVWCPVESS